MKSPVDSLPEQLSSSAPIGMPTLVKRGWPETWLSKDPVHCFHLRGQAQTSFYLPLPLLITRGQHSESAITKLTMRQDTAHGTALSLLYLSGGAEQLQRPRAAAPMGITGGSGTAGSSGAADKAPLSCRPPPQVPACLPLSKPK